MMLLLGCMGVVGPGRLCICHRVIIVFVCLRVHRFKGPFRFRPVGKDKELIFILSLIFLIKVLLSLPTVAKLDKL